MSTTLRRAAVVASLAVVAALGTAVLAVGGPANAAPTVAARPSITSVSFTGTAGPNVASPVITLRGTSFGATAPAGTVNNVTSCGTYVKNGNVYGSSVYFTANKNFEAGFSDASGADCIGITVVAWHDTKVVLKFGTSYGGFAHWYLNNGDGFAISINTALWGGSVAGLT